MSSSDELLFCLVVDAVFEVNGDALRKKGAGNDGLRRNGFPQLEAPVGVSTRSTTTLIISTSCSASESLSDVVWPAEEI